MLVDKHAFEYCAAVPFPVVVQPQPDWTASISLLEHWLNYNVGSHLSKWAWHDSGASYKIGVAFKLDPDRLLFVMTWG